MSEKVEFIESYIKVQDGDYQWNDNHGELIRCNECRYYNSKQVINGDHCEKLHWSSGIDWFCADGERREENESKT